MNQPVSPAPQAGRTAPPRRRTRNAARLRSAAPAPAAPQPREAAESVASDRPLMSWVLVTDDSGRTRPEARWI
ncbi:hypothetical protein [Streptomonospora wellingtoniae]|uniref:Uncharacterized protein n=1 Tax=Streptomonospora wellingtoniae TaxID=3075544 RepID=A0ABU2KRR4_9ACTN|nr:hypothetical protein [Streptomonospora sp. DSM 45055]MDT0301964.1 hypothetical protein [Streptomonospora sp. DSM 45055]